MQLLFINNDGGGFADHVQVSNGITVEEQMPGRKPADYLIRVNRQWAVMAIVAQDNSMYARLSFNVGPGGQVLIPTAIDHSEAFGPTDHKAWQAEYCANVRALDWLNSAPANEDRSSSSELQGCALPYDFLEEFENLDPAQRQILLDELAERPDLWNEESEVLLI